MNSDSIEKLKKDLPNCFPPVAGNHINWDDVYIWPTNPIQDHQPEKETVDRRREEKEDTYLPEGPIDPEEVIDVSEKIRKKLDSEPFPGGPGYGPIEGAGAVILTPEVLAFYLPYHKFIPELWGIYLIAEGVMWLRNKLIQYSQNQLNLREAESLAKAFLFYHEQFHNRVESYSTKMEIAQRKSFYISGLDKLYKSHPRPPTLFHEESFANKNGVVKACEYFVKRINPKSKIIASNALETYIKRNNSGPYKDSLKLKLGLGSKEYKSHEANFLEEAYRESISASGKVLSFETWQEFSYRLSSNLPLGARCSYITLRNSSLSKRLNLGARLFKTKKLEKWLKKQGAIFEKSKVHKARIRIGNKKSDLPFTRDMDPHTANKIVKDLHLFDSEGKRYNFSSLRDAVNSI